MYWLKKNAGKIEMSEMSVQSKLQVFRSEQENYLEDSFDTICAYKEHAAMMHYSSKPETNVEITNSGMLLIDSGGQYLEGTTDITRTFVLGDISEEERYWFTKALRGHYSVYWSTLLIWMFRNQLRYSSSWTTMGSGCGLSMWYRTWCRSLIECT